MAANFFDPNELGGNQINEPYNGLGEYTPFVNNSGLPRNLQTTGGGNGGGQYIPPTPPNPTFVPPSYTQQNQGTLTVSMLANDIVEFLENDINVGTGQSQILTYSPSLTFGNQKIYKVNSNGKVALNYFEVSVEKKYKQLIPSDEPGEPVPNFLRFNTEPTTNVRPDLVGANERLYDEIIKIREFNLQPDGTYILFNETNLNSVNGTVNLDFRLKPQTLIKGDGPDVVPPNPIVSDFKIEFVSNLTSELGDFVTLDYLVSTTGQDVIMSDSVLLSVGNIDTNQIEVSQLLNSYINFDIKSIPNPLVKLALGENGLPQGYDFKEIYWTNKVIADRTKNDYTTWNKVGKSFRVNGSEYSEGIVVAVVFEQNVRTEIPKVTLANFKSDIEVKESDTEREFNIPFSAENCDFVDVYINPQKTLRVKATDGFIKILFKKDFNGVYGRKKLYLLPLSEKYGVGGRVECIINYISVNDFPSIIQITSPETIDIPSFSDLNVEYDITYQTFAVTSVDVDLLLKDKTTKPLFTSLSNNGSIKINLKTISEKYAEWNGSEELTLIFKPINNAGDKKLVGNTYEITTKINYSSIRLDEDIIKTAIFDAFSEHLKFVEPEPESKYLTHLANFGNDEHILISSWENDNWTLSEKIEDELGNEIVSKEVQSVILKLYSPLPADIGINSTFWITKLITNPLIETVVLSKEDKIDCPPLRGPNFSIDVDYVKGQSTAYESLDNILYSAPTASLNSLLGTYVSSSIINTENLNIEYYSGSNYLTGSLVWENFVRFSSAKERVDNFVYKVQLIEAYEILIESASTLSQNPNALGELQEAERQTVKRNQILNNFDGFEKFLYTSASNYTTNTNYSITWPYNGTTRLKSDDSQVILWYNNIIELAENYDNENGNYLKNNIPQYILDNNENENYLLFISMLGHHFDNIYYFSKSIERSRGLGYKAKNGISDKLLFEALASFGWDAKNLSYDTKLWEYALGINLNAIQTETNPAKKRTYELWRRIINNLPYLLKHKGTRKGIYALLSCYGIPSSNLSILEFGGPEVGDTVKGKLVIDSLTNVLKLNYGASITIPWQTTDKGRNPNTIEFFVKPNYASDWTLISGSNWNVSVSGSQESKNGKIFFNYDGTNYISSSILPVFNDNFFGVSVSSGSTGVKLEVAQTSGERLIFSQSITSSNVTNWNNGSTIEFGAGDFSGSIEEIRLWSEVLDKDRFIEHVYYPEMINGNHISSSSEDLYFRLDFEYPKNVATYTTLINVDPNIYFSGSLVRNDYETSTTYPLYSLNTSPLYSASLSGFNSITDYPYQFEVIDKKGVLEIPDLGSTRYSTNKVRFESQYDLDGFEINSSNGVDLSIKTRATKKAFDNSPIDSNRVGLFFSPNKELNFDIAKSFGSINLDNYIADPSDRYSYGYKSLDKLRNYYFGRIKNRNIYDYINIVKLYEKAMFDDIKKMLPARVNATTGLLIEPHFLERSKYQYKKPSGENNQNDAEINYSDFVNVIGENNQNDAIIDTELYKSFIGENNQYTTTIQKPIDELYAESYLNESVIPVEPQNINGSNFQYDSLIDIDLYKGTKLSEFELGNTGVFGQNSINEIGPTLYAEEGHTIRTYRDKDGVVQKERVKVDILTKKKQRYVVVPIQTVNGEADPRFGYKVVLEDYYEDEINIQPYLTATTLTAGTADIVSVKPLSGYLPNHPKKKSLPTGLQNSYFKGAKNTSKTTLDGSAPVETFATNPNTLKVGRANRDTSEPILET